MVLAGLFIMFFFGKIVGPWGPVTEMGVTMLGVFFGMLIMIIGSGTMAWPCLIALFACVFCGYTTTSAAFASFLGTSTTVQMLAYLAICEAIRASGAGEVIAKFIVTRKFIQGRPVMFTFFLFLAFFIAGIFIPPTGGIIFAYSIFASIAGVLGYEPEDEYYKFTLVGLYLACMLGVYTLPFKSMSTAVIKTFTANLSIENYSFNNGMYILATFFAGIAFLFIYALCIKVLFKCDLKPLEAFDVTKLEGFDAKDIRFTRDQTIYCVSFCIGVLYSLVLMFVPKSVSWYETVNSWGAALWMLLVIGVLGIVRIDGKNIFSVEKNLHDGTMWGIIIAAGVLGVVGGALSSEDLGIRAWLLQMLGPVLTGVSWPVFILAIVLLSVVITNFFSNMVTGIILATIAAPFLTVYATNGIDISAAAVAICFSIHVAYLTPAAFTAAPILLGHEGMNTKFIWTKGLFPVPLYILLATVVFSLAGLIF